VTAMHWFQIAVLIATAALAWLAKRKADNHKRNGGGK